MADVPITNVGLGYQALYSITGGEGNTAVGNIALYTSAADNDNTAVGFNSLNLLNGGTNNTTLGSDTGDGLLTGSYNTIVGSEAGTSYVGSESGNIILGCVQGTGSESNIMRLGNDGSGSPDVTSQTYIEGIYGNSPSSAQVVIVNALGQMGSQAFPSSSITITGDSGGGLTGNSFTFTGGSTGLTFAGAGSTETLGGTLIVGNGGTGAATFTSHGVIYGNTTSPLGVTAAGTTNTVLLGNTGSAPSFGQVPNAALVNDSITVSPGTGISVSGSPVVLGGTVTISATGTSTLAFTGITSGPYTVLSTDNVIGVTSSSTGITVELPNAPATGTVYTVKDSSGNSSTYNITITTVGGSVTIDGATSQVVNTNYESVTVIFDGSNYEII